MEKVVLSKETYDSMTSQNRGQRLELAEQYEKLRLLRENREEIAFKTEIPTGFFSSCSGVQVSCNSESIIAITIDECKKLREQNTKLRELEDQFPRTYKNGKYPTSYPITYLVLASIFGFVIGAMFVIYLN